MALESVKHWLELSLALPQQWLHVGPYMTFVKGPQLALSTEISDLYVHGTNCFAL